MPDDNELVSELYAQYHDKVLRFLNGKLNNLTLAEDLCSDVFMKVYAKRDAFDPAKASASTWIFTITRNRLTDYYRTRRVFSEVPETLDDGSSLEEDVCNRETLDALATALEALDERSRDIIILRYYSGNTLKEIAEKMSISYAYVKVLHNKALSLMKDSFEQPFLQCLRIKE